MKTLIRFSLVILLSVFASLPCFAQLRDFSSVSSDHKILSDMRFDATEIAYHEKRNIAVAGREVEVLVFTVKTKELVSPTVGVVPVGNVYNDLEAVYELMIGTDPQNHIHDRMIADLYKIASQLGDKDNGPDNIGLVNTSSSYLIFQGPVKRPELIWYKGKFAHVRFVRFDSKIGRKDLAHDTETLWQNKLRFYDGNDKIAIKPMKAPQIAEFLRKYRDGKFANK